MPPPRSILFCIIAFFYLSFCQLYIFLFIANVSENDAAKWLESMAWRLAQDLKSHDFNGIANFLDDFGLIERASLRVSRCFVPTLPP